MPKFYLLLVDCREILSYFACGLGGAIAHLGLKQTFPKSFKHTVVLLCCAVFFAILGGYSSYVFPELDMKLRCAIAMVCGFGGNNTLLILASIAIQKFKIDPDSILCTTRALSDIFNNYTPPVDTSAKGLLDRLFKEERVDKSEYASLLLGDLHVLCLMRVHRRISTQEHDKLLNSDLFTNIGKEHVSK